MSAEVPKLARQRDHFGAEMLLDFVRIFDLAESAGLGQQRRCETASSVSDATITAASLARSMSGAGTPQPASVAACASIEALSSGEQEWRLCT
jgi:hypothetical protein